MLDFTPMNDFISHVLAAVDQDGAVITKVFPGLAGLIVIYKFTDRLANDVVSINSATWSCGTKSTEKNTLVSAGGGIYQSAVIRVSAVITGVILDSHTGNICRILACRRKNGGCRKESHPGWS
jgi:recyclin-1